MVTLSNKLPTKASVKRKINSPLPTDLAGECRKAANILNGFIHTGSGNGPDAVIPPEILNKAKGLAIFTVIKAGFLFSGRAGSGLVVARLPNGTWSAPSAIGTGGMGFGGQIGAEVTDFVVILNTAAAVRSFATGGNVTLGGNLSVAAGPIGRNAEASGSITGMAAMYSYSKTRGLFAGISIEGSVIIERKDANAKFYQTKVTANKLLSGEIPPPVEADAFYRALSARAGNGSKNGVSTVQYNIGGTVASPSTSSPSSFSAETIPPQTSNVPSFEQTNTISKQRLPPPVPGRKPSALQSQPVPTATALYDFTGQVDGDLSFRTGDVVAIVVPSQGVGQAAGWAKGYVQGGNGVIGMFPENYVRMN